MKQASWYVFLSFFVSIILISITTQSIVAESNVEVTDTCSIERHSSSEFSPDGKYILSTWNTNTAKLWSTESGQVIHTFVVAKQTITLVAFSFDGKYIATGVDKGIVVLWDTETGKQIRIFTPKLNDLSPSHQVIKIAFTPDSKYMVTDDFSRGARLWEVQTGKQIHFFPGEAQVMGDYIYLSTDGKHLITQGNGNLNLWDIQTRQLLHTFTDVAGGILSSTGQFILTWEDQMNLWDVKTFKKIKSLETASSGWEFSKNDHYLAIYERGYISLWDVRTGKNLHTWELLRQHIYLEFLPDNEHLLFVYDSDEAGVALLLVWDVEKDVEAGRFKIHEPPDLFNISVFKVSPDGKYLLFDSYNNKNENENNLYLWDIETGKQVYQLC